MKKSKLIVSVLALFLLIALMGCVLSACDVKTEDGTGSGSNSGSVTLPTLPTLPTDTTTTTTTTTKPKPPRPTKTETTTGGGESSNAKTEIISPYKLIASLMGGTQIETEIENYRVVNFYVDIKSVDMQIGDVSKQRLVLRLNLDQNGNASEMALVLIDMTGVVEAETGEEVSLLVLEEEESTMEINLSASKLEEDIALESQGVKQWGLYAVEEKLFMDLGDSTPLLYFEDFDMDYVRQIAGSVLKLIQDGNYDGKLDGQLFQMLNGLMSGIGFTVDSLLNIVGALLFDTAVCTTSTDDMGVVTQQYKCEIKLNNLISTLDSVVGMVVSLIGGSLPFDLDLKPFISFLTEITPKMKLSIEGTVVDGITEKFDLVALRNDIVDKENPLYMQEILRCAVNMDRSYQTAKLDIGIPQRVYDNIDFEPFSLTNIALSLDLVIDTGEAVDLGAAINSIMAQQILPENVLVMNASTGLRLEAAIDFDLNYGNETYVTENGEEKLVDNNLLMLELYLIDAVTREYVDTTPLIGAYYMEGGLYVNVDHLLDRYYAGSNIKINLDGIPSIVQYVTNLVTNALDKLFKETLGMADWVNWADLRSQRVNQEESVLSSANEELTEEEIEIYDSVECVALAYDEFGNYQVSTNVITLLKSIGSIVGFGDLFGTNDDQTAIVLSINAIFWKALTSLAGDLGFTWPDGMIARVDLNFSEDGFESIDISAAVDSRDGFIGEDGYWYVGQKASYKSVVYSNGTTIYTTKEMTSELVLTPEDSIDNYCIVYVQGDKYYLDNLYTEEVLIGYDNESIYVYKVDSIATGILPENAPKNSKGKQYAFVYNNEWVIGYGHDEGEFVKTSIPVEGLSVGISLHSFMLCYNSEHLDKFNPELGGTSYNGVYGAETNLEGYILYRTHERKVATGLSNKTTGTFYTYNNTTKEYTKVELGTGEGKVEYDPETTYYQIVEKNYVDSVSKFLTNILSGTYLSMNLTVDFSQGCYNLAPLISMFGLTALADKQLLWNFTADFKMDVSLNIGIALNKEDPTKSYLILEIATNDQDICIGDEVLFKKNTTILGLYGVGNNVYIELSNLRLLNIKLPDLYLELDYTTLIYSLLGDKEIMDLTFDLAALLGINPPAESTPASAGEGEDPFASFDKAQALLLNIDSNIVSVAVTVAAIQSLLGSFGIDLGIDLNEVMKLSVELVLNRTEGITLGINGALLPKWTKETGNYFDEDLSIMLQMGTDKAPVQIGDVSKLIAEHEVKFNTLAASTELFYDNIIDALLRVIGDLSLTLTLDATTVSSLWDINRIVDNIVVDQASSFAIPMQVNFDDWNTEVQLALQWYLDFNNFKNTQIKLELIYEGNLWIGLYIYQNSIIIDANGLGLFDFEIANSTIVAKLGVIMSNLLGSLGDLSLTSLVNGLVDSLLTPTEPASEIANADEIAPSDETAASDETASAGESQQEATSPIMDVLGMLLPAISANNTQISLDLTSEMFDSIFQTLLGFDLHMDLSLSAAIDFLAGTIGASLNVEDAVFADITVALGVGERGAYKFEKNLDNIPDWNAVSGEFMVRSLLKNLDIGLFIDLNQYTSTSGEPLYTRIYIEKLKAKKALAKTNSTAAKDSILVTVAAIDQAEFNNTGSGSIDTWLYAELNYNDGKLYLNICKGFLPLKILGGISVDVGDVMGQLAIDLDLVTMLSGTIDGLLSSIDSMLDKFANPITGEPTTPEDEAQDIIDESAANTNVAVGEIKATEIISSNEFTRQTNVDNIGKYYFYGSNYYQIVESGSTATTQQLTVNTNFATFADLPQPSAALEKIIYQTDAVTDATTGETTYSYYICLPVTRRVYGYYTLTVQNGLSAMFGSLDFLSLFDMITLSLTSTGILNADITINEYQINNLIDGLMYYIFGPETILNLQEMTKDNPSFQFSGNYLAQVFWDRINGGALFDDIYAIVDDILGDILKGLIGMDLSGLMGAITNLKSKLKSVINRLIPFAVTNETHLGLNLVSGQLTNIYLTCHDHNTAIYDPEGNPYTFYNGESTLSYNPAEKNRSDLYYTELHIFNTSPSVGNPDYVGHNGAVTWDGIPSTITYDPYSTSSLNPLQDVINTYFTNKEATYQENTNLYKSAISFRVKGFTKQGESTETPLDADVSSMSLSTPGTYRIVATAPFNGGANTKELTIKFVVRSGEKITSIKPLSMSVYEAMPPYITVVTADNVSRRFATDTLQFYTKSEINGELVIDTDLLTGVPAINHTYGYMCDTTEDGSWDEEVYVLFPNGAEERMTIHYFNSTVSDIIMAGAKDNVIEVDLYQFDTKSEDGTTTALSNYTPDRLYFYYENGYAGTMPVDLWDLGNAEELFYRLDSTKPEYYGSVEGATYKIKATIAKGTDVEQDIVITFNVKSKQVTSVSFGERINTLDVQPYEFYLYQSDMNKYANLNPYSDQVLVNYDNYSDYVYVKWNGISDAIDYSWNNNNDYSSTGVTVTLDPDQYPSGDLFTWTQPVTITMSRNEIMGVYFDEALTKSTLTINPYDYNNLANKHSYYPSTAYIKFTNGKVLEMPIAWKWNEIDAFDVVYTEDYNQFTIAIGYDISEYNKTGVIEPYSYLGATPFYQEFKINVHVDATAVKDVLLEGSVYSGGTYKIDPVTVNFQNGKPFPDSVSVIYENGVMGTMKVVKWEYDFEINMEPQKGLTAKCYLTNDLYFNIACEVLDRSASRMIIDTSEITAEAINPYSYNIAENGSLTYDVFTPYLNVGYVTSYIAKLEYEDGLTKKTAYSETVVSLSDLSVLKTKLRTDETFGYNSVANTYTYNEKVCKLTIENSVTTYELPVYWDTTRLNLTSEGGMETVYFYFGYGTPFEIEQTVDVEFLPKVVDHIGDEGFFFQLMYGGTNLSEAEQRTGKALRNLKVYFTDGTSEFVECLVDLTTLRNGSTNYGYAAGSRNRTKFDYVGQEVDASTAGSFYIDGSYNSVTLRGNGVDYDAEAIYYSFEEYTGEGVPANGTYYVSHNEQFIEVELTGSNYSSSTTYYTRSVATVTATSSGTYYTYDPTGKTEVTLTGSGVLYNANTTYTKLVISNEMQATVTVAYGSGTLVQKQTITVYVM